MPRQGILVDIADTGNAAFSDDDGTPSPEARRQEIARILRDLADKVENGREGRIALHDYNGNKVGYADFNPEED